MSRKKPKLLNFNKQPRNIVIFIGEYQSGGETETWILGLKEALVRNRERITATIHEVKSTEQAIIILNSLPNSAHLPIDCVVFVPAHGTKSSLFCKWTQDSQPSNLLKLTMKVKNLQISDHVHFATCHVASNFVDIFRADEGEQLPSILSGYSQTVGVEVRSSRWIAAGCYPSKVDDVPTGFHVVSATDVVVRIKLNPFTIRSSSKFGEASNILESVWCAVEHSLRPPIPGFISFTTELTEMEQEYVTNHFIPRAIDFPPAAIDRMREVSTTSPPPAKNSLPYFDNMSMLQRFFPNTLPMTLFFYAANLQGRRLKKLVDFLGTPLEYNADRSMGWKFEPLNEMNVAALRECVHLVVVTGKSMTIFVIFNVQMTSCVFETEKHVVKIILEAQCNVGNDTNDVTAVYEDMASSHDERTQRSNEYLAVSTKGKQTYSLISKRSDLKPGKDEENNRILLDGRNCMCCRFYEAVTEALLSVSVTITSSNTTTTQPFMEEVCSIAALFNVVTCVSWKVLPAVMYAFKYHPLLLQLAKPNVTAARHNTNAQKLLFILFDRYMYDTYGATLYAAAKSFSQHYEIISVDNLRNSCCKVCNQSDNAATLLLCGVADCPNSCHRGCTLESAVLTADEWYCSADCHQSSCR